jgi:hypothetical protein
MQGSKQSFLAKGNPVFIIFVENRFEWVKI